MKNWKNHFYLSVVAFMLLFHFIDVNTAVGQTNFTPTQIADAQPDFTYHPGRGLRSWTGQWVVNNPVEGTNTIQSDDYIRYAWYDVQDANASGPGASMIFTKIDADFHAAITGKRRIWVGFLLNFGDLAHTVAGAKMVYPTFVHMQMQSEATKDFINGGYWYENPNSPFWHDAVAGMLNAFVNHINTTSFNGVPYSKVLEGCDIRICGDFGEGAVLGVGPTPAAGPMNALVDVYKSAFNNYFLDAMIGNFSGGQPGPSGVGITPKATSTYLLTQTTSKGLFGWRRDNWGQNDNYIRMWTDLNPNVDGFRYDTAINNRYKYAPVIGEPQDQGSAGNFEDFVTEVLRNHPAWVGNGNFNGGTNATIKNNFRAASLAMGYRWHINNGNMSTTLTNGTAANVTMVLQNVGVAPDYQHWIETFQLRQGATVVYTFTGAFDPYLIIPGTYSNSTNFTPAGVPAGTYDLYVGFVDAQGYVNPMPLAITGRTADGFYPLRTGISVGGTAVASANAGVDQTITAPTASVFLDASASVLATSFKWTQVSGPNTAAISISTNVSTAVNGLIPGVYIFQVQINGTGPTDVVQITVNAGPTANAGPDQSITLPVSAATISAFASTGTIGSYNWTKISGPAGGTITSPTLVSTTITGLNTTGAYVYRVTLNGVGGPFDDVQITVNATTSGGGGPGTTSGGVFTTQTPVGNAVNDGQALELGMKFRSTVAGFVTAIKFYKAPNNVGTHIGQLYSSAGTLLATVTFSGETSSGWQTATLSTPVVIVANTTYVVAYFSPGGWYNFTSAGFLTAVNNSPLIGLADGTDGHNGVYIYSATPAFPTSYSAANNQPNYFVDVNFTTSSSSNGVRHHLGKLRFKNAKFTTDEISICILLFISLIIFAGKGANRDAHSTNDNDSGSF